ncbi:transposase [Streptomyces sp. NPDC001123]
MEGDPRDPPRRRPGPRPSRAAARAGRHRRGPALPARVPGPAHPAPAPSLRGEKWSSETVYAITDLPAEAEIASWARGHWTVEDTVHWCRDVTFNEDKSQVRTHNAPAVLAALRDLIRSVLKLAGYANTAAGRRAHTDRHRILTLYRIT